MKMSRAAVVIGAAVVLVGGGAFAVEAATSDPNTVALCVNSRTTTVSAPRNGDCVSGDLVVLPSEAAVDLLKNRVTGLQGDVSDLNGQVTGLQGQITDALQALQALQTQIDDLKTQATNTKSATYWGTSSDSNVITMTVGYWTVTAFCHPAGTAPDDVLDGVAVKDNTEAGYVIASEPNTSGSPGQVSGPVAYFKAPKDTQAVQLVNAYPIDGGLTLTVSVLRGDNTCWVNVVAVAAPTTSRIPWTPPPL